jgi:hypothetical protein
MRRVRVRRSSLRALGVLCVAVGAAHPATRPCPQAKTVPEVVSARECQAEAAMALTLRRLELLLVVVLLLLLPVVLALDPR